MDMAAGLIVQEPYLQKSNNRIRNVPQGPNEQELGQCNIFQTSLIISQTRNRTANTAHIQEATADKVQHNEWHVTARQKTVAAQIVTRPTE